MKVFPFLFVLYMFLQNAACFKPPNLLHNTHNGVSIQKFNGTYYCLLAYFNYIEARTSTDMEDWSDPPNRIHCEDKHWLMGLSIDGIDLYISEEGKFLIYIQSIYELFVISADTFTGPYKEEPRLLFIHGTNRHPLVLNADNKLMLFHLRMNRRSENDIEARNLKDDGLKLSPGNVTIIDTPEKNGNYKLSFRIFKKEKHFYAVISTRVNGKLEICRSQDISGPFSCKVQIETEFTRFIVQDVIDDPHGHTIILYSEGDLIETRGINFKKLEWNPDGWPQEAIILSNGTSPDGTPKETIIFSKGTTS